MTLLEKLVQDLDEFAKANAIVKKSVLVNSDADPDVEEEEEDLDDDDIEEVRPHKKDANANYNDVARKAKKKYKTGDHVEVEPPENREIDGDAVQRNEMRKAFEEQEASLTKALGAITTTLKQQQEAIQELRTSVESMARSGAGRKSVSVVGERPGSNLIKSQQGGMSKEEFMTKALAAQRARPNVVTSAHIYACETAFANNQEPPEECVKLILG